MSVNHTATVLVGLNVKSFSSDIIDNIAELFYDDKDMIEMFQNCWAGQSEHFIGYMVQSTDCYDECDIVDVAHRILALSARFKSKFGMEPKVIIMDHVH